VKDLKPKLNEDGTVATYDIPVITEFPKKNITFTKIDGFWFLNN